MSRAISLFCCLFVGLQFLIGVPALVCLVFFALYGGLGPISIEVHPGANSSPPLLLPGPTVPPPEAPVALAPPPNIIPAADGPTLGNPLLEARAEMGSPLTGTVLAENSPPHAEDQYFVAAIEKVAAEFAHEVPPAPPTSSDYAFPVIAATCPTPIAADTELRQNADQFAIRHLYEMAETDECAANYERADQWRALAREIRAAAVPPSDDPPVAAGPSLQPAATSELP